MGQMRAIEVDFDVHQAIELERTGFEESPNDALRRLLKLPPKALGTTTGSPISPQKTSLPGIRPWSGKGVELPHGTELRMEYNGQLFRGSIENGEWVIDGKRSNSPSAAAASVATTKKGTRPSLDGWKYWEIKRPNDAHWRKLGGLRGK
ncbi:MAG: hypothetical protein ACE37J_04115 [Pikeienuella sp.]|uniref:hypothetical protein n=1 Tax=Pikeienuella sp. TaxID=2831957 RepID=UPI00391D7B5E